MGVYQAYWVTNLGMAPTRASLISSTLFLMTCLPSPFISLLIHKTRFRPNLMVAAAIPILTSQLTSQNFLNPPPLIPDVMLWDCFIQSSAVYEQSNG